MKVHNQTILPRLFVSLLLLCTLNGCGGGSGVTLGPPPAPKPEFLYVTAFTQVLKFKVGLETGALGTPVAIQGPPNASFGITTDPSRKFLYGSDFQNDTVEAFSIDATSGSPKAIPCSHRTFCFSRVL
jgi:hypothetical protein